MKSDKPLVLVYKGRGVGPLSFRETVIGLRACLPSRFQVHSCVAAELIDGTILKKAVLFAMPGGRDVPYSEDLKGPANRNLRTFVEGGGGFLGICAGAYYGAARVVFEQGHPLEVLGTRELAFFPGDAVGTVYEPGRFVYDHQDCTKAALLHTDTSSLHAYYNGGCYFKDADVMPGVNTVAVYQDAPVGPLAAIVECTVGKGKAILSGAHLDYRASILKEKLPEHILEPLIASNVKRLDLLQRLIDRLVGE